MGSKYVPSVKDQKASHRFQQKQKQPGQSKFIKPASTPAPKPATKKKGK